LAETDAYNFSHLPRMATATMIKAFYSPETKDVIGDYDAKNAFSGGLPENFFSWHHLSRAQYLEARSLLAGYILSSQGDRVSAANSVEGRFPFLDYRIAEFAAKVPPWHKILGLNEKYILKRAMTQELPKNILDRVKQPYMSPDSNSFVQLDSPSYVAELLSEDAINATGVFASGGVTRLADKCRKMVHKHLSFKDNMSFVGILSTQILMDKYITHFEPADPLPRDAFHVWHDQS
ncbi:MAG: asparagine synthase C-terminal domain-containing protein, partial [candidate division Zixibacteria bacterium]|nr:asparagine synthase C-terminal domain-containing protein [candidate division Zixibacteria bacterium]